MNQTQPTRWEALTEAARRCVAEKQLDKAEEAFLAALREAEQFGDADPRVAVTLNALARVYHRRSKFFPAAALLHRLLGIKEREHGEKHPELAGILSNLAEMYSKLGDARQELELRERALEIRVTGGEAEGGALEGLRGRIAELRQKLADEKLRDEEASKAPRARVPVPTGATDLPLILPAPLAPNRLSSFSSAFEPARNDERPPATSSRAAKPVSAATAASSPAAHSVSVAPAVTSKVASAVSVAPAVTSTAASAVSVAPAVESTVADAPVAAPAAPRFASPSAAPIARPTPKLAPQPFTGQAPALGPIVPLAPEPAAKPRWRPLAPPAPVASWPDERDKGDTDPQPDDYVEADIYFAPRRNWKPIAFGGLTVAVIVAAAAMLFGGPETAGIASGQLVAQPAAPAPAVKAPAPITSPAEAQALEAGLANLQQEHDSVPQDALPQDQDEFGGTGDASRNKREVKSAVSNGDTAREARLRVAVPSLALDNVTKSIEAAARARVDSLTRAEDKQVYEYKGKKPRQ
jgi:hypothetical protein